MEANTNDEEAPKDPGALKALTSLQDNDIFGKLNRFIKQKRLMVSSQLILNFIVWI